MQQIATLRVGLEGLKEIALPEPVAYTPQTTAWYILFGVVFLLLTLGIFRLISRWKSNRYRRQALSQLKTIEASLNNNRELVNISGQIPLLVKWTTLQAFPRERVARLSGDKWLNFLDNSYGGKEFSSGSGQLLPQLAYSTRERLKKLSSNDIQLLIALLRRWIRRFRV